MTIAKSAVSNRYSGRCAGYPGSAAKPFVNVPREGESQRNGHVPATFSGTFPEVVHSDSDAAVRGTRDGVWQALDVLTAPVPSPDATAAH